MNKLKLYISLFFIAVNISWFITSVFAQDNLNFIQIDKLTYQYYNQQKWDSLIDLGKQAQKNDIDFYYLQYRIGIAYYSKKNYRKAIPYFENVISKTPEDAIAKEYLYYSYLFALQTEDARKTMFTLEKEHRKKVKFYNYRKTINSLYLGYKGSAFDSYAINSTVVDNLTQKVRNSLGFYSIGLLNYAQNESDYYFNFSLLNGKNSVFDATYSPLVIDEDLKQYQFYFSWNKNIAKGSNFKLGLTYMYESIKWYDLQPTGGGRWSNSSSTLIYNGGTSNFVAFLSYSKSIKNIDLKFASSFSRVNENTLVQPSVSLTYYPFGNTYLYTKTSAFYQFNITDNSDNNMVLKQSINSDINSKLGINILGLYGKIYNFIDNDGLSIYNNLDAISYWYGLSVNYNFSKKSQLYVFFRNDGQINQYFQGDFLIDNPYNVKSVLVGVKFNF